MKISGLENSLCYKLQNNIQIGILLYTKEHDYNFSSKRDIIINFTIRVITHIYMFQITDKLQNFKFKD